MNKRAPLRIGQIAPAGTSKKSPAIADRADFKRWCVGPREVTIDGRTFKRLPAIQAALGHSEIDLLKMDIEGYE